MHSLGPKSMQPYLEPLPLLFFQDKDRTGEGTEDSWDSAVLEWLASEEQTFSAVVASN